MTYPGGVSDFPLVVFISGSGSILAAICEAIESGTLRGVSIEAVIADTDAPGLAHAQARAIPTHIVPLADFPTREQWDARLAELSARYEPALIVLAGFMRLLGAPMLERFSGRIINTHPALLPAFPGAHAVRDALAYGVKVSGASIIEVDAGVDTGRIIAQRALSIRDGETEHELHERIKEIEREMMIEVVRDLSHVHAPASSAAINPARPVSR